MTDILSSKWTQRNAANYREQEASLDDKRESERGGERERCDMSDLELLYVELVVVMVVKCRFSISSGNLCPKFDYTTT